jgi:hypothetical protein
VSQSLAAVKIVSRGMSTHRLGNLLACFRRLQMVLCVAVGMMTQVAVAQQCSAADIIALSKAGYTKQDINALCMVDVALLDESVRVDLSVSAINQFLDAVLPLQISNAGTQNGVLQNVKYCKADSDHAASLVAYGTLQRSGTDSSTAATNQANHLKGPLDCSMSADLNRQHQSDLGVILSAQEFFATIVMEWSPWGLKFKMNTADRAHAGLIGETTLSMQNLPVAIGSQTVPFNIVLYFLDDRVSAVMAPAKDLAGITQLSQVPTLSSFQTSVAGDLPPSQDIRVRVSHQATQLILNTYFTGNQAVLVQTGNSQIGDISLSHLQAGSSVAGQYTVSGNAASKGGAFSLVVTATGADLAVNQVQISPLSLQSCPAEVSLDAIRCNASNAALQTAATVLGNVVTAAYKGELVRNFGTTDVVQLPLGSTSCNLSGTVKQVSSTEKFLQLDASVSFQKP